MQQLLLKLSNVELYKNQPEGQALKPSC